MSTLTLYHGTDQASANNILTYGLDASRARRYNGGGEFWATTDQLTAEIFAQANPAGGTPVCVVFALEEVVLQQLLAQRPVVAELYVPDTYRFLPPCFDFLNQAMTNKCLKAIP